MKILSQRNTGNLSKRIRVDKYVCKKFQMTFS